MLRVEALSTRLRGRILLSEVTLHCPLGEVTLLLGRNGSGKSTLMRSVMGLMPIEEGEVRFKEKKLGGLATWEIAHEGISYVPERGCAFPGLSVRQNLEVARRFRSQSKKTKGWSERVLDLFPILGERMEQRADTLSGGERQMLGLAMALSSQVEFVLLDDPTHGISALYVARVLDLLQEIVTMGTGILLVEQSTDAALQIATRVYVLEQGKLRWTGDAEALQRDLPLKTELLGEASGRGPTHRDLFG